MSRGLLAVVPARRGSKRLENKNFKKFYGKALYLRALEQALALKEVSTVLFSSDVTDCFLPEGVLFDKRPELLAQDNSSSQALAQYLWQAFSAGHRGLLWLQPTSPLRTVDHINDAIEAWAGKGRLASFSPVGGSHLRIIDEEGLLREKGPGRSVNLNGAIYLLSADEIASEDWIIGAKGFEMAENDGIDIDDAADWQRAEALMEGL